MFGEGAELLDPGVVGLNRRWRWQRVVVGDQTSPGWRQRVVGGSRANRRSVPGVAGEWTSLEGELGVVMVHGSVNLVTTQNIFFISLNKSRLKCQDLLNEQKMLNYILLKLIRAFETRLNLN